MLKGNMKNRKKMSGCAAALVSSVTGKSAGSFPGPVKIQDSTAQSPLLQVSGFTVPSIIWEDLMPVLNHTSVNMRCFLTDIFGVQEEHHVMENFGGYNSLAYLISHAKYIYNNTHGVYSSLKKN